MSFKMNLKPLVIFGAAAAVLTVTLTHAAKPTAPNALYSQTALTFIPPGTCTGTGTGCAGIMGIDWLSDGRMVVLSTDYQAQGPQPSTNRPASKVTLVSGLLNNGTITTQDISTNFKFPTGMVVVNNKIYVADFDTFYVIPDNTGASPATNRHPMFPTPYPSYTGSNPYNFQFPAVSGGYGTATTSYYHHFVFTPVYYQGKFYANYSGSLLEGTGTAALSPSSFFDGSLLAFDTTTTRLDTNVNRAAGGFRSPNGNALGLNGQILSADNQGSYFPMCTLTMITPFTNQYLGYQQDNGYTPNWAQAAYNAGGFHYTPPLAVMDYAADGWRSVSQPLYLSSGPYAGDWLVGDVYSTGIARVGLDSVTDTTGTPTVQGAVFWFENTTGNDAVNRLNLGPDGNIYVGIQRQIGNWPMGAATNTLYKFSAIPNASQFEIRKIRSVADGFELYLTQPANPATVIPANFSVQQASWVRTTVYGAGENPYVTRTITAAGLSNDSLRIHLTVSGILRINQGQRGDTITHWATKFMFNNLTSSTGAVNFTTEATYAQNWISSRVWNAALPTPIVQQKIPQSQLGDHVWLTTSSGLLHVNVDMAQPYRATLLNLQGRILSQENGSNAVSLEFKAPGATPSLYLLEVHSGSEVYGKVVFF